jgi:ribonuclease HI
MSKAKEIKIYTDGATTPNPGRGGYGIVVIDGTERTEYSGGFELTTNNRMELYSALVGLESLEAPSRVTVYSDSRYLVDGITKGWALKWESQRWYKKASERTQNPDLWKRILSEVRRHDEVKFIWIKGHSGIPENERCDELAVRATYQQALPSDVGYLEYQKSGGSPYVKEGDPCMSCGTPLVTEKKGLKKKKGKKEYYYAWYYLCPECNKKIYLNKAKVYYKDTLSPAVA